MKTFKQMIEQCKSKNKKEEPTSKNPDDPRSRFDGTKALVKTYKKETPGEN